MPAFLTLHHGSELGDARAVALVGDPGLVALVAADLVRSCNERMRGEKDPARRTTLGRYRRAARLVLAELMAGATGGEADADPA